MAEYTVLELDHLSVSEVIETDPWKEVRLHGKIELSLPTKHLISESQLDRLVDNFSVTIRRWIEEKRISF